MTPFWERLFSRSYSINICQDVAKWDKRFCLFYVFFSVLFLASLVKRMHNTLTVLFMSGPAV